MYLQNEDLSHYFEFDLEIYNLKDKKSEDKYLEIESITNSESKDCGIIMHNEYKTKAEKRAKSDNELIQISEDSKTHQT